MKTSLLAKSTPAKSHYARILLALAYPETHTDDKVLQHLRVRLRYAKFGTLSENERGFRTRDTPEFLEINIFDGKNWGKVLEVATKNYPMTSEEPAVWVDIRLPNIFGGI